MDSLMATTTFDTLRFANTLKAAGVPDKQAEPQASVLGDALAVNFKELATKDDLKGAIGETDASIVSTEQRLNAKIDSTEQRLNAKIDNLEQRLNAKIDNVEQRLNARIDNLAAKFDGQFTLLKWMIGLSISLNVTVLS